MIVTARTLRPAGTAATLLALATGASAHADATDRTVWAGAHPPRGTPAAPRNRVARPIPDH